jgi:hypothetical protein
VVLPYCPEVPNPPILGWFKEWRERAYSIVDVGHATWSVYCAVAAHADDQGDCWPTYQKIRQMTGCDHRTIFLALAKLEAVKWLRRGKHKTPTGWCNSYRILPPRPHNPS